MVVAGRARSRNDIFNKRCGVGCGWGGEAYNGFFVIGTNYSDSQVTESHKPGFKEKVCGWLWNWLQVWTACRPSMSDDVREGFVTEL